MIDAILLAGILKDKQREANKAGIEIDVIKSYECYYQHHKTQHGSYKYLQENYFDKMQERQVYCLKQIDEVIKSKKYYLKQLQK